MRPALLISLAVVFGAAEAAAQDTFPRGIDMVPIKLTPTMDPLLSLDGAELLYVKSWQAQAILDFNIGLLGLKSGGQRIGDLIPFRTDLHLMGAYQVHPRIELSADVPITVVQLNNFQLLTDQGFPQRTPSVAGLGAPRILGRFQIIRVEEFPIVSVAAIAELRVPIGDTVSFMSDRGFVFAPRLAVERTLGPVRIVGNLGWRFRTAPGQYMNLYVGHEFLMGAGAQLALPDIGPLKENRFQGEVNLVTPAESPFTFKDAESLKTPFELLLGARSRLYKEWGLLLALGKGLGASGYGREAFRVAVGVTWEHFKQPDRDGDGVPDAVDQCPDVPEDLDGFEDTDGCPEPGPDKDTDGDGVPDKVDGCPTEPGPGPLDGCPDRDGDQIPDNVDKCPDVPGEPDLQGCPPPEEEAPVVLESERLRIKNQIQYEFGSARIDPRSFGMLDEVAKVLSTNADVGPVLIEGHTDNIGPREFNLDLSRRRARSVEDYLITKGIDKKRLRSDGFGFDRPLVPNDSATNRARNRRTEFRLVDEGGDEAGGKPGAKGGGGAAKEKPASPAAGAQAAPKPAAGAQPAQAKPAAPAAGAQPAQAKPAGGGAPAPAPAPAPTPAKP